MARKTETASLNYQATASNPKVSRPITSSRPHANFKKVKVHTAKCDSCEKNNKLTLYRCMECGQHVCSLCWRKSGDGTHVFGGGSPDASKLNSSDVIVNDKGDGKKGHENANRTRGRRRVRVIISDDDDDDDDSLPVLKPASTTEITGAVDASEQQSKRINAIMNGDHHQGHEDGLPDLWPMLPARGRPVSRPTVSSANISATDSPTRVMQGNPHLHEEEMEPEHQSTGRVYNSLRRQTIYVPVDDQETNLPAGRPLQPSISNLQGSRYAYVPDRPVIYRPRPGSDPDKQAAHQRNQLALDPRQKNSNIQGSRPGQASVSNQQANHYANVPDRPAIYRPRPGANVDLQAARSQLAFAPQQKHYSHQAPRPGQASVSHQQAVRSASRPAQRSFSISQHHVQTAANTDQMSARDRQTLYMENKARANANAKAKLTEAHNRQALSSQQNTRPEANRDQVANHNQQAFISNRLASSAAGYEQMMAAREHQQAYLSHQQANRQLSGTVQTSVSLQRATNLSPYPDQAFPSQTHAASGAFHQVQEYSPETIEAADALLSYARVEQSPRDRFRSEQDPNGDSHLLSGAGRSAHPSTTHSQSRSSSTTLVSPPRTVGAQSISPHPLALNPNPRATDADSAQSRLDMHRRRLAGLHSPSGAPSFVSDTPASQRSHPSHRHAALQPGSGPRFAHSSAAKFNGSSFHHVQSHPGSRVPVSDHAAAYLNQWDSGRAALYANSSSTAIDVPAPQLESPRSAVPAVLVQDTTTGGKKLGDVAEDSILAPITPDSGSGGSYEGDVRMGSPEVDIPEDTEPRSGNEKHLRSEKNDESNTSKEHKAFGDVDVFDARKRDTKEEHEEHPNDDDKDSDVEITSWDTLDSNKTTVDRRGANAETKEIKPHRILKRGVARVKKPEPNARKGKVSRTVKHKRDGS